MPHDWSAHFNSTVEKQHTSFDRFAGYSFDGLNPDTTGYYGAEALGGYKSKQYGLDGYITGKISPLGVLVETTAGVGYSDVEQGLLGVSESGYYDGSPTTIPWDASQFAPLPRDQLFVNPISEPTYRQQQLAGYASVRISPVSWAHLLVAERISDYRQHSVDSFGTFFTTENKYAETHVPQIPNIGLTFDVMKDTAIYGSYASIYQIVQAQTTPNGPFAPPVTGSTFEGGIKRGFFDNRLQTSVAYYASEKLNVPVFNPAYTGYASTYPLCCYLVDGTRAESKGIDFEVSGKLTENLDVAFSYTYNNNKTIAGSVSSDPSQTLNYQFPKHIVKFFATLRPVTGNPELDRYLSKARVGFGVDYKSLEQYNGIASTYNPVTGDVGTESFFTSQKGYALFQLMAKYDITEKASIQLNAYNIADRKYYQTVGGFTGGNYYGTPRSFAGTLHLAF